MPLEELGGSLPLGGRPEADEGPERTAVFRAEEKQLALWAERTGTLGRPHELIPAGLDSGKEHRVLHDPEAGIYRKTTHPGSFGGYLGLVFEIDPATQKWIERPLVLSATPREYLDRLRLAKAVFGDDSVITKVIATPEGFSIETVQSAIAGVPASAEWIAAEMTAAGFRQLHADGIWYRDRDGVLTWDLEGNAIVAPDGRLAVIDAMIRTAPASLAAAIEETSAR